MPFSISTTRHFSAAHQLRLPGIGLEPLHGHNWQVEVTVERTVLEAAGWVMDFHELERLVDKVVVPMHNRHLNDLPAFAVTNPSAENVAAHVAAEVAGKLPGEVRLTAVKVWETAENAATYRP